MASKHIRPIYYFIELNKNSKRFSSLTVFNTFKRWTVKRLCKGYFRLHVRLWVRWSWPKRMKITLFTKMVFHSRRMRMREWRTRKLTVARDVTKLKLKRRRAARTKKMANTATHGKQTEKTDDRRRDHRRKQKTTNGQTKKKRGERNVKWKTERKDD